MMKSIHFTIAIIAFAVINVIFTPTWAATARPLSTEKPEVEQRLQNLFAELRCLKCQNQSLASSRADLADDLRREVRKMVKAGKSDAEVKQFLVNRYGEFVLFRPKMSLHTGLLWFGPFLMLLIGLVILLLVLRRTAKANDSNTSGDTVS